MEKNIILIEGYLHFPIKEARKILKKHGYQGIFRSDYNKLRKSGVFHNFGEKIAAIFCGPRPHKVKEGSGNLLSLEGNVVEGIPIFICTPFTMNPMVKITKSSFTQTIRRFQFWKKHDSEQ